MNSQDRSLILGLKFSTDRRQAEDMVGDGGKDPMVLLRFSPPFSLILLNLEEG